MIWLAHASWGLRVHDGEPLPLESGDLPEWFDAADDGVQDAWQRSFWTHLGSWLERLHGACEVAFFDEVDSSAVRDERLRELPHGRWGFTYSADLWGELHDALAAPHVEVRLPDDATVLEVYEGWDSILLFGQEWCHARGPAALFAEACRASGLSLSGSAIDVHELGTEIPPSTAEVISEAIDPTLHLGRWGSLSSATLRILEPLTRLRISPVPEVSLHPAEPNDSWPTTAVVLSFPLASPRPLESNRWDDAPAELRITVEFLGDHADIDVAFGPFSDHWCAEPDDRSDEPCRAAATACRLLLGGLVVATAITTPGERTLSARGSRLAIVTAETVLINSGWGALTVARDAMRRSSRLMAAPSGVHVIEVVGADVPDLRSRLSTAPADSLRLLSRRAFERWFG